MGPHVECEAKLHGKHMFKNGYIHYTHIYPYYRGLEDHGLGGSKLQTQHNTHAATQWFKKKKHVNSHVQR